MNVETRMVSSTSTSEMNKDGKDTTKILKEIVVLKKKISKIDTMIGAVTKPSGQKQRRNDGEDETTTTNVKWNNRMQSKRKKYIQDLGELSYQLTNASMTTSGDLHGHPVLETEHDSTSSTMDLEESFASLQGSLTEFDVTELPLSPTPATAASGGLYASHRSNDYDDDDDDEEDDAGQEETEEIQPIPKSPTTNTASSSSSPMKKKKSIKKKKPQPSSSSRASPTKKKNSSLPSLKKKKQPSTSDVLSPTSPSPTKKKSRSTLTSSPRKKKIYAVKDSNWISGKLSRPSTKHDFGLDIHVIDGKYIVARVTGLAKQLNNIKVGDELIKLQDKHVTEYENLDEIQYILQGAKKLSFEAIKKGRQEDDDTTNNLVEKKKNKKVPKKKVPIKKKTKKVAVKEQVEANDEEENSVENIIVEAQQEVQYCTTATLSRSSPVATADIDDDKTQQKHVNENEDERSSSPIVGNENSTIIEATSNNDQDQVEEEERRPNEVEDEGKVPLEEDHEDHEEVLLDGGHTKQEEEAEEATADDESEEQVFKCVEAVTTTRHPEELDYEKQPLESEQEEEGEEEESAEEEEGKSPYSPLRGYNRPGTGISQEEEEHQQRSWKPKSVVDAIEPANLDEEFEENEAPQNHQDAENPDKKDNDNESNDGESKEEKEENDNDDDDSVEEQPQRQQVVGKDGEKNLYVGKRHHEDENAITIDDDSELQRWQHVETADAQSESDDENQEGECENEDHDDAFQDNLESGYLDRLSAKNDESTASTACQHDDDCSVDHLDALPLVKPALHEDIHDDEGESPLNEGNAPKSVEVDMDENDVIGTVTSTSDQSQPQDPCWECRSCHFQNSTSIGRFCSMCGLPRPDHLDKDGLSTGDGEHVYDTQKQPTPVPEPTAELDTLAMESECDESHKDVFAESGGELIVAGDLKEEEGEEEERIEQNIYYGSEESDEEEKQESVSHDPQKEMHDEETYDSEEDGGEDSDDTGEAHDGESEDDDGPQFSPLRAYNRPTGDFDSPSNSSETDVRRSWKPKSVVAAVEHASLEEPDGEFDSDNDEGSHDEEDDIHSDEECYIDNSDDGSETGPKADQLEEATPVVVGRVATDMDDHAPMNDNDDIVVVALVSMYPDSLFEQMPQQKRAMNILKGVDIVPELVDGADPNQRVRREELFALSGHRAVYPQFFLRHGSRITYFCDFDALELMNDAGELLDKLHAT